MKSIIIVSLILVNAVLLCASMTVMGRQINLAEQKEKETEIADQNARNGFR
jgi:flagellar basal body-associated protein FliL